MRVEIVPDRVIKRAETEGERIALRREARALRTCAHPGVVPVLAIEDGDPPDVLVLASLPGGSVAEAQSPSLGAIVGWGVAVASTLGDLHAIGWVHGAVSPDHVIFDSEGRPVLCSFGRAEAPAEGPDMARAAAADVAGLATMLLERLPEGSDRRLVHLLCAAAGRASHGRALTRLLPPSRGSRMPARQLARRLMELVPDARLGPGDERDLEPPVRTATTAGRGRPVWIAAAATACAGVAVTAAALGAANQRPRSFPPASRSLTVGNSDRYVLAGPPGAQLVTVIGRWGCGPARPAVADLRTGWIWVFDRWPAPGSAGAGRLVGHVRQPVGLAVRRSGSGCQQLVALEGSGHMAVIAVSASR